MSKAKATALLELFKGIPDPAAELARLRQVEADYQTLRSITESDGETFRAAMQEAIDARRQAEAENATLRTLYAAAEEECKAFRTCPHDHFSRVWSQPQMSGKQRSKFRQAIVEAADAHDKARADAGKEAL